MSFYTYLVFILFYPSTCGLCADIQVYIMSSRNISHIQRFLELDELDIYSSSKTSLASPDNITSPRTATTSPPAATASPLVRLDRAAFSWNEEEGQNTVSGVSFSLTKVS